MTHRGKPKRKFFRKKEKEDPYANHECFACYLLNAAGKTGGHPRKGHIDKTTRTRCGCWCNQ